MIQSRLVYFKTGIDKHYYFKGGPELLHAAQSLIREDNVDFFFFLNN